MGGAKSSSRPAPAGAVADMRSAASLDQNVGLINRLGEALVSAFRGKGGWAHAIASLRTLLDLEGATLWTIHRPDDGPVKESGSWAPGLTGAALRQFDERLLALQLRAPGQRAAGPGVAEIDGLAVPERLPGGVLSIPLMAGRPPMVGVLNLYPSAEFWRAAGPELSQAREFLRALCGQIALFVERKELEAGAAVNREIHHRVKNNLHTVASLLRLQLRRMDRTPPDQALLDSINRILGIAAVHELLAHAESGMVDLARLVKQLGGMASQVAGFAGMTVDHEGPRIMVNGGQATVLALVVNELLQNALDHGVRGGSDRRIHVLIAWTAGAVSLTVEDDGVGLPAGFTLDGDVGLGLELVQMLTAEELKGDFTLEPGARGGATARVVFPPLSRTEWVG